MKLKHGSVKSLKFINLCSGYGDVMHVDASIA